MQNQEEEKNVLRNFERLEVKQVIDFWPWFQIDFHLGVSKC